MRKENLRRLQRSRLTELLQLFVLCVITAALSFFLSRMALTSN